MTNTITYTVGDVRDVMATMPDRSVDLVVTSPPFLALRSYLPSDHPQKHREIGSEPTPAEFLDTLLELTAEWRRLFTPTGSIAVELGDTYSGSGNGPDAFKEGRNGSHDLWFDESVPRPSGPGWPLAESLCGIPTLYTWSLAYGRNLLTGQPSPAGQWRIRNLIVWHRPNPPVGALGDKVRPSTSYITTACVSDRRWFDLDSERGALTEGAANETARGGVKSGESYRADAAGNGYGERTRLPAEGGGAPPLDCWHDGDTWTIPTQPYTGAHYATFPLALPRRLINLMCPRQVCAVCGEARRRIVEATRLDRFGQPVIGDWNADNYVTGMGYVGATGAHLRRSGTAVGTHRDDLGWTDCGHDDYRPGLVLDPFAGTGTTALAAALLHRDAVCIDLDPRNIPLARHRIGDQVAILAEQGDGPTTTWTVDAGLPGVKGEAEGQLNLFAEDAS